MRILLLSGLLALASRVLADGLVTYKVIGFPDAAGNTFAVEIDKKLYPLRTSKSSFPLWSAKVANDSSLSPSYRYVQLSRRNKAVAREGFMRQLENADTTQNEFFGREVTITDLPPIKQVYEDVRPEPSASVFDCSQIATMHFTVDPDEFEYMMNHPKGEKRTTIKAGFKFINANTVYSADEVKFKVSGHHSRIYQKVSLEVKFDKSEEHPFFNQSVIKMRAEYTDPSMLRERLYLDVLNSIGVPTSQGSYARVYVNGKPQGFYQMVEDIEETMLMRTVHRGSIKDKTDLGALYKMGHRESTLNYMGPKATDYPELKYRNIVLGDNPEDEPMQRIIEFMKDLQDWNPKDSKGIAYWNERLDLDGFLRAMALEYLAGAWDAFWWNGNNYFMYYNPQSKVWQFIPSDFDHTFNSGGNRLQAEASYKTYGENGLVFNNQPLVSKLILKNKDINRKFETILSTITEGVFNSEALEGRMKAYETQLEKEVEWDLSIDRSNLPGTNRGWTINKFHKSIWKLQSSIARWIRNRSESVAHQFE
ncbi:spore coat protein H [Entomortierella parvispora]|uniref:Spore coat protein H n=1 Tax=Entomortierella parvispora TaxID=205924 RepID=A0A9P3HF57_9FUNG|nr:spore coat protein H [Entomortierella parvispora]